MDKKYQKIWKEAVKYLRGGVRKNFVIHAEGVVKAMEMILKKEKGDADILILAAMLHDVGWCSVPEKFQMAEDKKLKQEGMQLHIKNAGPNARKILREIGYPEDKIKKIASIVMAHKSNPRKSDKRILIDADALSDVFRKQFASDMAAYENTAQELYDFRKNNKFYTKTAKEIFEIEIKKRVKEYKLNG